MSLFLTQIRDLKVESREGLPEFPARVTAKVVLAPTDAFGVEGTDRRTTWPNHSRFKARLNTGEELAALEGELIGRISISLRRSAAEDTEFDLDGNVLELSFLAASLSEAVSCLQSFSQIAPLLFTFHTGIYIWIRDFKVEIGQFRKTFEASARAALSFIQTTKERREAEVREALRGWRFIDEGHRRLLFALEYYRQALRLLSLQPSPGTFGAEIVLNLNKCLEALFSSSGVPCGKGAPRLASVRVSSKRGSYR